LTKRYALLIVASGFIQSSIERPDIETKKESPR
jgi:hypothetical protein